MSASPEPRENATLLAWKVLALCISSVCWLSAAVAEKASGTRLPYELVLDSIEASREGISAALETVRVELQERAKQENRTLLERIAAETPAPREPGYAVLPELRPDVGERAVEVKRQVYSIASLEHSAAESLREARTLVDRAPRRGEFPLEPLVAELESLRKRLRLLDRHLNYHRFWQRDAVNAPGVYRRRAAIETLVLELLALSKDGPVERRQELQTRILHEVTPFRPTPGLRVDNSTGRGRVLPVALLTDIESPAFLKEFESAVEAAFNGASTMLASDFRLDLQLSLISPAGLYPEGPPEAGERLVLREHLRRFPEGELVLTTGAGRTHAAIGRSIVLGPDNQTPRTLAHEFAHLLGFGDGYLRTCQGTPTDSYGCVFVEWTGLSPDLMGAPGYGAVSEEMINQVLRTYSESRQPRTSSRARDTQALVYTAALRSPAAATDYIQDCWLADLHRRWHSQRTSRYGIVSGHLRRHCVALQAALPGATFVHLVRDGRKVVRSYLSRELLGRRDPLLPLLKPSRQDPRFDEWARLSRFERACWLWTADNGYLREAIGHTVQLERLVADYEYFEENLCRRIGVRIDREVWQGFSSRVGNPTRHYEMKEWSGWSSLERSTFVSMCGEEMRQCGYAI